MAKALKTIKQKQREVNCLGSFHKRGVSSKAGRAHTVYRSASRPRAGSKRWEWSWKALSGPAAWIETREKAVNGVPAAGEFNQSCPFLL